jgi:hypothetical protein
MEMPQFVIAPALTTPKMHTGRFIATITPMESVQLIPGPDDTLSTPPESSYHSAYALPTWSQAERDIISYQSFRAPASLGSSNHELMPWTWQVP